MSEAGGVGSRRAALLAAVVLGAVLVVVLVVVTPWTLLPGLAGGRTAADPSSVLPPDVLARAEAYAGALRPASLTSLLLGLAVAAALGLTPLGARLVRTVARPFGGGRVAQVLVGTAAVWALGGWAPCRWSP